MNLSLWRILYYQEQKKLIILFSLGDWDYQRSMEDFNNDDMAVNFDNGPFTEMDLDEDADVDESDFETQDLLQVGA